jgi:TorA maturation chaperone TorD
MAKSRRPSIETRHTLSRIRRDLYGFLSSTYIQIPEKSILGLKWDFAAELFRYPPKGARAPLKQIHKALDLMTFYGSNTDLPHEEILENLSKDWTRLLRGVVRDGILPPYESLYRTKTPHRKPAQEVNRLFSKMGIQVPEEWRQPSDYIGVELDFMRLLCEKERQVRERMENDILQHVLEIEASFLEEHLALWVPLFCEKMLREAREDYYRGVARLTAGLVAYDGIYVRSMLSG